MFLGRELAYHPHYSALERLYIRLLGVPIVGLRIRARNVFSLIPRDRCYREILDAGSGPGVFAFELARRFPKANVLGIDILEDAVEAAEQIRSSVDVGNVHFQVGDLVTLPEANRFDLVLCVDILEHIEDDFAALRAIHRIMGPEGVLILHVPALYRRYPVWKKSLNFYVETHVRTGYTMEGIRERVVAAHFSILEMGYTYGFCETLANNLSYMITKARMENRKLYALAFPFLNALSWLGALARPKKLGAGIYIVAEKGRPL